MKTTLELEVYEAIASFSKGNISKCEIFKKLGISPGTNCQMTMKELDDARIKNAVSYTHLDVYKRQTLYTAISKFQP